MRATGRAWIERRVVGKGAHRVQQRSIGKQLMEIIVSIHVAVLHEVAVEEVVEQVEFVADLGCTKVI